MTKWPKQVPVLKPEDFVLGPSRFCLCGWIDTFFRHRDIINRAFKSMHVACEQHRAHDLWRADTCDTLANRRLATRVWATILEDLGYTEDGPTVEM